MGVAQLLKSYFEWLLYIHCTAHRLNLVVNTLINTSVVATDVMSFINSLYTFLNLGKVRIQYENIFKETNPKGQVKHITQQIEIRWACKFEGIDFVLNQIVVIRDTLVSVINSDTGSYNPKHVETAVEIYHKLMSGKFIISLVALHAYLRQLFYLNKELQAERIDWTDVMFELTRTRESTIS